MSSMLVGYFSYDIIRLIEKIPDKCKGDIKIPDIRLMRPRNLIIYDNVKKKIFYIINIFTKVIIMLKYDQTYLDPNLKKLYSKQKITLKREMYFRLF